MHENIARHLLKYFSNGVIDWTNKKINLKVLDRRLSTDKKYFEKVKEALSNANIEVKLIDISSITTSLYKWFLKIRVNEQEKYDNKQAENYEEMFLTFVSTKNYDDEYIQFLDKLLRFYFHLTDYSIEKITSTKIDRVSYKLRLIIDPENNIVYATTIGWDDL